MPIKTKSFLNDETKFALKALCEELTIEYLQSEPKFAVMFFSISKKYENYYFNRSNYSEGSQDYVYYAN